MLNKMNKMEIAGLAVAGLGTIAGLGIAIYTKIKTGKESKEVEQIMETVSDCSEEIKDLLKAAQTIEVTDEMREEMKQYQEQAMEILKEQGIM